MTEQRAPFPLPPRPVGGPAPLLSPPLRSSSAPPALLSGTEQSAAPVLLPLHREGRRQKRRRTSPASQLTQAQPRRSPAHLPPRSEAAANGSRHPHHSRFLKRPRLPSARSRKEEETTPTPSPFPRLLRGAPLGDWALGRWRKRGSNTRTATPRGRGEGRGRPSRGQAGRESGPGSAAARVRVRVRRRAARFCPPREAAAWRDGIPFGKRERFLCGVGGRVRRERCRPQHVLARCAAPGIHSVLPAPLYPVTQGCPRPQPQ